MTGPPCRGDADGHDADGHDATSWQPGPLRHVPTPKGEPVLDVPAADASAYVHAQLERGWGLAAPVTATQVADRWFWWAGGALLGVALVLIGIGVALS